MADVPDLTSLSKGVTAFARDAAYVAVGLGVLGYQRAQVQRVGLQNRLSVDLSRVALDRHLEELRQGVAKGVAQIDELAESAVHIVEATLRAQERDQDT